jgi:hypothetical protein
MAIAANPKAPVFRKIAKAQYLYFSKFRNPARSVLSRWPPRQPIVNNIYHGLPIRIRGIIALHQCLKGQSAARLATLPLSPTKQTPFLIANPG